MRPRLRTRRVISIVSLNVSGIGSGGGLSAPAAGSSRFLRRRLKLHAIHKHVFHFRAALEQVAFGDHQVGDLAFFDAAEAAGTPANPRAPKEPPPAPPSLHTYPP